MPSRASGIVGVAVGVEAGVGCVGSVVARMVKADRRIPQAVGASGPSFSVRVATAGRSDATASASVSGDP
jgi:hypothetical protein